MHLRTGRLVGIAEEIQRDDLVTQAGSGLRQGAGGDAHQENFHRMNGFICEFPLMSAGGARPFPG